MANVDQLMVTEETTPAPARGKWSPADLLALPATVDLVTAGSILDIGRTKAHELARAGEFPTPVLKHGARYVVPVRPILTLLGIDERRAS